ncbi:MAG: luciferase family protein [Terracidiphilus sp.]
MKELVREVSPWPEVTSHEHRFGGLEFRVGAREIGHVHWFGIVDIPFTVAIRDALIRAGRAERHHWLPDSGWTTVRVNEVGSANARELLRLSYLRIRTKSADSLIAEQARMELEACGLEREVLEAAGVAAGGVVARG